MHYHWFIILTSFLTLSACTVEPQRQARQGGTFTILHTNDFHGRLTSFPIEGKDDTSQTDDAGEKDTYTFAHAGRVGGLAYFSTVVKQSRRQKGRDAVLLLHAGDTFSDDLLGNLTQGEAAIKLMNTLGYDFMALGNHDFDYGPQQTVHLQSLAKFPMRGANVIDQSTGRPFLGEPVQEFERGGVRIGVLALGYNNTPWTASKKAIKGLQFTNGIDTAHQYVPSLRKRVDVVLVVSHLGTIADQILAREVAGIDIIIGGHSHDHLDPPKKVGNAWIVQALSDAAEYGEVEVTVNKGKVSHVRTAVHTLWNDGHRPDPQVQAQLAELRAPHRQRLEEVIFTAAEPIARDYKSESPFDRLVGDILRQRTTADAAMLPGVGYGVTLQAGPVTREALYTLLPHPAKMVTLHLKGSEIQRMLEQSATNQKPPNPLDTVGGLIQTSGIQWTVDLTRPAGQRIRDVRIRGEALDPAESYRIVTHTGMLGGIHHYDAFAQGTNIERSTLKVVDVVERALHRQKVVQPPALGDVKLIVGW